MGDTDAKLIDTKEKRVSQSKLDKSLIFVNL